MRKKPNNSELEEAKIVAVGKPSSRGFVSPVAVDVRVDIHSYQWDMNRLSRVKPSVRGMADLKGEG